MPTILPPVSFYDPGRHADADPVRAWAAHLAAGRLGADPSPDPAVLATLLANDALFRDRACRHRLETRA